ncbi:MAG: hypothetical protein PUB99_01145 [Oscillospiraceae bacterium]|nr:hypothetical protein [Oscillospiraceae bacterium]
MKFSQASLIVSIAAAMIIFGLTVFLILQFNFLVGILFGIGAFLVLILSMMIFSKKNK